MSRGVVSARMPYRDDEQALQDKKEQLEQDRARIEEHKRALAHLTVDEARIALELADVERRLSKRKKNLPLLGEIRVASPCNADWKAMKGDEQTRYCDKCAKNVYNLSAMTTEQAEALIREKERDLCVRYFQRSDGTVMTADCPVGVRKKRVKTIAFVTAVGAAAAGGIFALDEAFTQGKMVEPETRMGKFEAFDFEPLDKEQVHIQATMGAISGPDNMIDQEEQPQQLINGAKKVPDKSKPSETREIRENQAPRKTPPGAWIRR